MDARLSLGLFVVSRTFAASLRGGLVAALLAALMLGSPGCTVRESTSRPPSTSAGGDAPGPTAPPESESIPDDASAWSRRAVYYELFVRSFRDSDGDGVGDLKGLIEKLDYLNDGNPATGTDLGVDALWLMPIFASPSYHGYDVLDYESVAPQLGTLADFQRLCDEAHRRGMKVVLDLVVNHTSRSHPWFTDSSSGPGAARRDWYVWSQGNPGWRQPWNPISGGPTWHALNGAYYYGVFWDGMPDLNLKNPDVRREVVRIAKLWLARGADGFRLDAARYLIETGSGTGQSDTAETHAFWKELAAELRAVRPDVALIGENWTTIQTIATYYGDTSKVPGGDELPLNFDFPLADAMLQGVQAGDALPIAQALAQSLHALPRGAAEAPFLTNHDQIRVATRWGGSAEKLRLGAAILLTLPGAPFVYYGEELGLPNGPGGDDREKRAPMPWSSGAGLGFTSGTPWHPFAPGSEAVTAAAQVGQPTSLHERYRSLVAMRRQSAALRRGGLKLLSSASSKSPVLAYVRRLSGEEVLVVHNLSGAAQTGLPVGASATSWEKLWADEGATIAEASASGVTVSLPPFGSGVFRLTGSP